MLPQARRFCGSVALAGAWLAVTWLGGCAERPAPEEQVRAVITAGEAAAEARDLSGILEHVSASFSDEHGGGREELKQYLRGYLVTHPSVHLLTHVGSVEFPYEDYARVELTVGTLGRESAGAATFDLAADVHDVVLELELEDDGWKVVRAAWQSTRRR